jgi:hypothetical protein
MQNRAHEEDGQLTPITEFDYDAIDQNLFQIEPEELAGFTQREIDAASRLLSILLRWIWQDGMKNLNGMLIRTFIVCWIFIRELRPLTETDLARMAGKDKQSLGRWVVQFKTAFPFIKVPHFK